VFLIIALVAALGYSVQNVLMAGYYRKMDTLSAVTWRGLTLGLSMAPILVFVPAEHFARLHVFMLPLLGASLFAILGNWAMAITYRHLPIGIANSLLISTSTIIAAIISYTVYGEILTIVQSGLVAAVLAALFLLGISKPSASMTIELNIKKGVLFALLFGLLLGMSYPIIGMTSRTLHPFLIGYSWELTIGIIGAAIALLRGVSGGSSLTRPARSDFWRILLYSSPTAIGTGFYALAMTLGPVAVATAILSTTIVFSTILAHYMYREHLSLRQWSFLLLVFLLVFCLQLAGDH